jgi:hypothetical protein
VASTAKTARRQDHHTHPSVPNTASVIYAAGVQQLAGSLQQLTVSLQQQLAETQQLLAGVVAELAQAKDQITELQHNKA